MAFTVLYFATRKTGVTPEAFKDFYDNKHAPLIKELTGADFPTSYTRSYIQRKEEGGSWPATVLIGNQADFSYDVIGEMTFADLAAFQKFFEVYQSEKVVKTLSEIEGEFMDTSKASVVVISAITETKK